MKFGHSYMLSWVQRVVASNPNAMILDYGCGSGEVVAVGRERGINILGTDVVKRQLFLKADDNYN